VKDSPQYAELLRQMETSGDDDLLDDLKRFLESFADHDDDCPGYNVFGRDDELAACTCGFARRHDFMDQLHRRLGRTTR
jgi:hypothetical protein